MTITTDDDPIMSELNTYLDSVINHVRENNGSCYGGTIAGSFIGGVASMSVGILFPPALVAMLPGMCIEDIY